MKIALKKFSTIISLEPEYERYKFFYSFITLEVLKRRKEKNA